MLKKQRLTAMEGKHHDAKPPYTRKKKTKKMIQRCDHGIDIWKPCRYCDYMGP